MKKIKFLLVTGSLTLCIASYGQANSERIMLGKEYAESELKATLKDGKSNNFVDDKRVIIKDSATSVAVAEPILFGIYGKDNIVKEKPYEIYHIDNYWVLNGTLPKASKGGTFLIILDSRNCRVLKIIHGK